MHTRTLGQSFDRQASFRRVASNADSLSRRPRNLSRCKRVTGMSDDVNRKLGISFTLSLSVHQSLLAALNHLFTSVLWQSISSPLPLTPLCLSRLAFGLFGSSCSVLRRESTCPPTEQYRAGGERKGEGRSQTGGAVISEEDPSSKRGGDVQPHGLPYLLSSCQTLSRPRHLLLLIPLGDPQPPPSGNQLVSELRGQL